MGIVTLFIPVIVVGVAIAAMVWVLKLKKGGELKEPMTPHEAKIMGGSALERGEAKPMFEKTFGAKKTLASASHQTSLSWREIGQAIKKGQLKGLWPILFVIAVAGFILFVFLA